MQVTLGKNVYTVEFRHDPLGVADITRCGIQRTGKTGFVGVGRAQMHPLDLGLYNKYTGMELSLQAALKNAKFTKSTKKKFWSEYRKLRSQMRKMEKASCKRRNVQADAEYYKQRLRECQGKQAQLGFEMNNGKL